MTLKKVLLIILDGFGIGKNDSTNAIFNAKTSCLDSIFENNPKALLKASGLSVGLPSGQMGNSEVGHMNIGAGRVVYQDLTYINKSISDETFSENPALLETIDCVKSSGSVLHIMGLLSDGGVHSHINHFYAVLKLAKQHNLNRVLFHIWTDGRDTSPKSAKQYLVSLQNYIDKINLGSIATICGRFYSMDRDNNWERTQKAYNLIASAEGEKFENVLDYIENSYKNGVTDEFIFPGAFKNYAGISENDAIVCMNFRPDRARQITKIFTQDVLGISNEIKKVNIQKYCAMTRYDETFKNILVAFKPRNLNNTLGEYISKSGLSQLRIAETEKYAHVTFFLNGGVEKPYKNEDRIIVNSPNVKTYDLQPEMSAYELTDKTIENLKNQKYDFITVNFANLDMVGHTGNFKAAVKAAESVDECIRKILSVAKKEGFTTIITADHGNAEKMIDENGLPFTAHTSNLVPFCIIDENYKVKPAGALCDIAPTILKILNLPTPNEMTGSSLIIQTGYSVGF